MLKRIIASTSLLLYLLLPFFNIQMMNIFYPNFLRNNHAAFLGIFILFILNIVLTILVITLSNKTNILKSRIATVGIYLFYKFIPSCFNYWNSKGFTKFYFCAINYIPFFIFFCFRSSYFFNCFIKILNSIYIKV